MPIAGLCNVTEFNVLISASTFKEIRLLFVSVGNVYCSKEKKGGGREADSKRG